MINGDFPNQIIFYAQNNQILEDFSNLLAKQLFCPKEQKDINCDCATCTRIEHIHDYINVGNFKDQIKKEEIKNIIKLFSRSALEKSAIKLYRIKGIENFNSFSANSLLKFLEEPPNNTFAILLTTNLEKVLPTIKSRCQIFFLEDKNNKKDVKDSNNIIDKLQQQFLKNLATNKDNNFILIRSIIAMKDFDSKDFLNKMLETFIESNFNNYEITLKALAELKRNQNVNLVMQKWILELT
ncbi:hypothetical protein NPX79_01905 [Spiroplasma endosymbiont of Anurida maritima]|uniref:hypothetical protein n=1 Tax=Spiroplasma endosymbiont of Anurida maritima TaxID=2967972 RepID=UPI0036D28BC0